MGRVLSPRQRLYLNFGADTRNPLGVMLPVATPHLSPLSPEKTDRGVAAPAVRVDVARRTDSREVGLEGEGACGRLFVCLPNNACAITSPATK